MRPTLQLHRGMWYPSAQVLESSVKVEVMASVTSDVYLHSMDQHVNALHTTLLE